MSRSKDAFGRAYDFGEAPTGCPRWLERFAEEQAAKEEALPKKEAAEGATIVEQSRNRGRRPSGPSIYDQMHAIMNGGRPARAGSVEAVVEQYQERTGLKDYMNRSASDKIAQAAARIKAAAEPEDEPDPEGGELPEVGEEEGLAEMAGEFGLDIPSAGPALEGEEEAELGEEELGEEGEGEEDIPEPVVEQMESRVSEADPSSVDVDPEALAEALRAPVADADDGVSGKI